MEKKFGGLLHETVNSVYITPIDELVRPVSSTQLRFIKNNDPTNWNHRESKPDLTEHSTRIGPGVRARRVLWWSQSDDIQDAFAVELHSVDPGRVVAWAV